MKIDTTKLSELLNNDEAKVQQFLAIYMRTIPKMLQSLHHAINNKDWENASIHAHSIKSQSAYLNLERISNLAYSIEDMTEKNENLDKMNDLFLQLKMKISPVLLAIEYLIPLSDD